MVWRHFGPQLLIISFEIIRIWYEFNFTQNTTKQLNWIIIIVQLNFWCLRQSLVFQPRIPSSPAISLCLARNKPSVIKDTVNYFKVWSFDHRAMSCHPPMVPDPRNKGRQIRSWLHSALNWQLALIHTWSRLLFWKRKRNIILAQSDEQMRFYFFDWWTAFKKKRKTYYHYKVMIK